MLRGAEGLALLPLVHGDAGGRRRVLLEVGDQRGHRSLGVLPRRDAQGDLRPGHGDHGVGGVAHARGVDADHGERRPGPQPGGQRAAAGELEPLDDAGVAAVVRLVHVDLGVRRGDESLDRDLAVLVVEGGEQTGELGEGVHDRAAEQAGVHGMVQGAHLDDHVDEAAQAGGQRRGAHRPVRGVGDDDEVRRERLAMRLDEGAEGRRARLLLALDEDGHADAVGRELLADQPQRGHVRHDAGLVVGGSPAVEASVALDGLEGIARPVGDLSRGLDVVVRVQQHRGPSLGGGRATDHGGAAALDGLEGDLAHPGAAQQVRDGLGAAPHGLAIVALERDRGDPHQILQVLDRSGQQRVQTLAQRPDLLRLRIEGGRVVHFLVVHAAHRTAARAGSCASPARSDRADRPGRRRSQPTRIRVA